MDIFQKSITPDKPRVLAEEQIYVYVPMATSTNAGIASYNRDQFDIIGSEVSLKWPAESFTQGPIETPSIIKVLDNEFEYTGNSIDLISGNNKISSDKLEVQLKRILRDAYERPELVMLDPNYFVRTIVEKDGKQYYKHQTTAIHYNMSQNLSEYEQAQARQNISASSISDNEATNKRIDALLQTGVYSINGKTGDVILTTSDIENNSDYTTNSYVNEQVNTLNTNKADLDYVNEQLQLINSDKADVTYVNEQVQLINSDKATIDFVNSSIATNTATFRGTYNSLAELEAYAGEKDNNDYAFVIEIDAAGNTLYNRYKYVDNKWTFEYTLNNSSFTEAQWAAINSGITDSIIETIRTNITNLQNDKVSKVDGKGLSTNDFTDNYKLQVENNTAARHIHNNKTLLDTYTQTEVNLADAVNKKHVHNNKTLLDTYTQTEVNLADAVNKKHIHDNKEILDGITASYTTEEKAKLNGIADGAEVNVQADWEQTDSSSKDYIKNKPLIPEGVKLYSSTGENTDGAMTQKAVTDEFKNNVSIVFAEAERQKSKNLLEVNNGLDKTNLGLHVQINNDVITVDGAIASGATAINVTTFNPKIYAGKTYTLSFKDYSNLSGFDITTTGTRNDGTQSYNMLNLTSSITSTTITADADYELKIEVYAGVNNNISGTFKLQLEEGTVATDYQPYNGQITHNGDAPVVFAESEKNRAINLFNYKTQAGTSEVTNNQDGSFTISNLTFYYPSLILNIALKPNTKYTFTETVLEVSDSVGLEASNVAFGVVVYYTDGTYSSTPEIPIRGTGRYSGTFTTNSKTIDNIEYRILRKNNSTSVLNGKVTDISVCEGDNTVYYPYEGPTVHEEQLKDYLPLAGGTMTGKLSFSAAGNYPIIITSASSADTAIRCDRTDTNTSIYFGIGSGGYNRGIYDLTKGGWQVSLNQSNELHIADFIADGKVTIGAGDNKSIQFSRGSYINYKGTSNTLFGIKSSADEVIVGHTAYNTYMRGKADRLSYNDKPLALTSDIAMGDNFTTYTVIDATTLDENTWYPVTFDASRKNLKIMLFNQWNGGNPSWATHSTKNYGCVKIWETTGHGWGELGTYRKVYLSVFTQTNTDPVRGIGQLGNSSTEYVYVRGGGKYNFYTSHNVVPVLRTSTYTAASQSIAPTTTAPAEIVQTIMSTDTNQTISGSKTFTSGLTVSGRVLGSGDDEGIVVSLASNNYAGICLGDPSGQRAVLYLRADGKSVWRWSNGSSSYDISHPQKAGTIALTDAEQTFTANNTFTGTLTISGSINLIV